MGSFCALHAVYTKQCAYLLSDHHKVGLRFRSGEETVAANLSLHRSFTSAASHCDEDK